MLIDLEKVSKIYQLGAVAVSGLVEVTLHIQSGEDVAIVGQIASCNRLALICQGARCGSFVSGRINLGLLFCANRADGS